MKTNRYEFESKFSNGQRIWFVQNGKVATGVVSSVRFESNADGTSEVTWMAMRDNDPGDRWVYYVTVGFATEAEAIQERDKLNEEHKKTVL